MTILTFPSHNSLTPPQRAKAQLFEDPASVAMLNRIEQIAASSANALIIGETGTGKELLARHIHNFSPRGMEPFVAVNCGAFSESLVESELFGHEKGSFTGAVNAKAGWFESANGGTLFLDEIGDLTLPIQVKLLRVLQEREVVRLGSRRAIPLDVRIIAATNVSLEKAIAAGRFREDLYFRLRVAWVNVPPLRARKGDILPLAYHFLKEYGHDGFMPKTLSREAEVALLANHWSGNIRELENVIHNAVISCQSSVIPAWDLQLNERITPLSASASTEVNDGNAYARLETALTALFDSNDPDLYENIEACVIRTAYKYCHRNQLQTAKLLGISRNIARARLAKCGELPGREGVNLIEESKQIPDGTS